MAKNKRYSIIELKQNVCVFRQFDTFESNYFCNHDKVWLDSKKDCKGCKYGDFGDTREQLLAKVKTALQRKMAIAPVDIDEEAKAVIDFLGIK